MSTIRKVTSQDVPALAPLFDAYRVFYEKASDLGAAHLFLKERIDKNEAHVFVAELDGKLIAFTLLYPLFSSTRMKPLWLLNDLFVHPEYRGQGHSVALINAAKDLARATGAAGLILETAKQNVIGNQLYPKTGFVCDEEHNYYSWDVE